MKPILVGEANPYGGDPYFALYPSPPGCAGHRLCKLILGMDEDVYLDTFERVNLCPHKWSVKIARVKARDLMEGGQKLILLGTKVRDAFGLSWLTPFTSTWTILSLPHPSGLNRIWGQAGMIDKARTAILDFLADRHITEPAAGPPQPSQELPPDGPAP